MRKSCTMVAAMAGLAVALWLVPVSEAHAGFSIAASVGQGYLLSEPKGGEATSLMIAPGFGLLDMVRVELGVVGALDAARAGEKDSERLGLQLRPMLVIDPPIFPMYGRVVMAAIRPFDSDKRVIAYGGALGFDISMLGIGVFAEAGVLPRSVADEMVWVLEGRAGAIVSF